MPRVIGILLLLSAIAAAVPYIDELTSNPSKALTVAESETDYSPRDVMVRADRLGQFVVYATINGRSVQMLADTGASAVLLTEGDAKRAGFDARSLDFDIPAQTANGTTFVAGIVLDTIEIKGIVVRDVPAMVAKRGKLSRSLLGMTFLGRLANVTMSGNTLVLTN